MRKQQNTNNGRQELGMGLWPWLLGVLLVVGLCGQAHALDYDLGTLGFTAENQSMWGSGDAALSIDESWFFGTDVDVDATIDAFIGDEYTIPNPEYYVVWLPLYEAWQALNPGPAPSPQYVWIENPLYTAWRGLYWTWQAANPGPAPSPAQFCTNVWPFGRVCVPNPAYTAWQGAYWLWQQANPGPAPSPRYLRVENPVYTAWEGLYWAWQNTNPGPPPPQNLVVDTTTGAMVDLAIDGRVGIEANFMLDSGSVDATADFAVTAELPDAPVEANTFFTLSPSSTFASGTIATQSPWVTASVNGVLELAGSVTAQACLALVGCTDEMSTDLGPINYYPEIVSIDPNTFSMLDGLFEIGLASQTLSVEAGLVPPPGLKVSVGGLGFV